MDDWKKTKLHKIIDFNPFERIPKGRLAKKIAMEKLQPFSKFICGYEEAEFKGGTKFRNGDTLLARITPCLENGKTAQVTILENGEVGFGSTEYVVMREIEGVSDKDFIYYLSISPRLRRIAVKSMVGSSGRQRVQQSVLENLELSIPPLPTQRKIAAILSSLDDKIEKNRKTCAKLEEIASAVFKRWFVDFEFPNDMGMPYKSSGGKMVESELGLIPEGWDSNKTKELFSFIVDNRGRTPPTVEEGRRLVENWHISSDVIFPDFNKSKKQKFVTEATYNTWFRKGHPVGWDILYSTVGTLNKVSFVPPNCDFCIAQNIVAFRVNSNVSQFYFYNYMLSRHFVEQAHGRVIETVQASIKLSDIYTMDILVPSKELIEKFDEVVKPIYKEVFNTFEQNRILMQTRDMLLPKLISGELSVEDVEV